jgi:hypothetical protein
MIYSRCRATGAANGKCNRTADEFYTTDNIDFFFTLGQVGGRYGANGCEWTGKHW